MIITLQQAMIVNTLNLIIKTRKRFMKEETREKMFKALLPLLFLVEIFVSYLLVLSFMVKIIFLTFLIGIVLCFTTNKELENNKINNTLMYPLLVISISFLITAFVTKTVGYVAYSFVFGMVIPAIIIVFSSLECDKLYFNISKAIEKVFLVVLIMSFFTAPLLNAQYSSIFGNPNAMTNFLSIVLVTQLYLLENGQESNKIRHIVHCAITFVLCLYSASRTGLLCFTFIIFVYLFYLIKNNRKYMKDNIIKIFSMVATIFLLYFVFLFLLTKGTGTVLKIEEKLWGQSYTVEAPLYAPGEKGSDADVYNVMDRFVQKVEKGAKGEASFSSGRVDIWKDYIKNIGIVGHRKENRLIQKKYYSEPKWCYAHNAFLQLSYSGGVLAGISFLLLCCFLGIKALKGKVKNIEEMMFLAFLLSSGFQMMLGSNYSPYQEIMHLLLWIITAPAFKKIEI